MVNTYLQRCLALLAAVGLAACQAGQRGGAVPAAPSSRSRLPSTVFSSSCVPQSQQPVGTITEYTLPQGYASPAGLAFDSASGSIWVAIDSPASLGEYNTWSKSWNTPHAVTANSGPVDVTIGPDGNPWFTEFFNNSGPGNVGVVRLNNSDAIQEYPVARAFGIDTNPNGYMYVGSTNGRITRLDTNGPNQSYAQSPPQFEVSSDSAQNVWYATANPSVNKVVKIAPSGVVTQYNVPSGESSYGITEGPPGTGMWFTEYYGSRIGNITPTGQVKEYVIPTANSHPVGIVAACGNLWFTEQSGNKVGRITTSGQITEYAIPTSNSSPNRVTVDATGTVWFSEVNTKKIASIVTQSTPPVGCSGYSNTYPTIAPPTSSPAPISTTAPAGLLTQIPVSAVGNNMVCGPSNQLYYATGGVVAGVTMQFDPSTGTLSQWSSVGSGVVAYRFDEMLYENGTFPGSKSPQLAKFSTDGSSQTYFADPASQGQLVLGPDSYFYTIINTGTGYGIQQIQPDGTQVSFGSPPCSTQHNGLDVLADVPPGLWTHGVGCGLVMASTAGSYTVYPSLANDSLSALVSGPDQAVYASDTTANAIVRINEATGATQQWSLPVTPEGLIAGPDGTVWFPAYHASTGTVTLDLLHLTTGQLIEYDLAGQSLDRPFTVGSDSNIYTFIDSPQQAILKINPSLAQ